jgi:anti-sigma factor RsiW
VADAELTCKELTELITDYLEDLLPHTERVRIEEHLSVCPACVTYLDQMRFTIKALGAKPRGEIPKAIESNLLQAFRSWKNSPLKS